MVVVISHAVLRLTGGPVVQIGRLAHIRLECFHPEVEARTSNTFGLIASLNGLRRGLGVEWLTRIIKGSVDSVARIGGTNRFRYGIAATECGMPQVEVQIRERQSGRATTDSQLNERIQADAIATDDCCCGVDRATRQVDRRRRQWVHVLVGVEALERDVHTADRVDRRAA